MPDVPGAPDDFPENLRQIFYNIMMCVQPWECADASHLGYA